MTSELSDLTESKAIEKVYIAVSTWMKNAGALAPRQRLEYGRTFAGDPPGGYKMKNLKYLKMCDDLEVSISASTRRKLTLSKKWRNDHSGDAVGFFVAAIVDLLMVAEETKDSVAARERTFESANALKASLDNA